MLDRWIEAMVDRDVLRRMFSGRVVVACVGNQWRADDGVGPLVGVLVRQSDRVRVVDCGDTPENFLGVMARMKPEKVIVIDAADFGGAAGQVRVLARREVGGWGISTHAPRLTLFTDFVEAQTEAETYFLAVQPGCLEMGQPMGAAVDRAARELADLINDVNHEIDRSADGLGGGPG